MEPSPEIEAVVRRMWNAFVTRDGETIANLSSARHGLRLVLSDNEEWFRIESGLGEMMSERAEQMSLARVEFDRLEAFQNGDTGWWAAILEVQREDHDPMMFRQTGVAVLEAGIWRATQIHTSIGVAHSESFGYRITGALAELVDSLDERTAESVVSVSQSGTVTLMFTDIEDSTVLSEAVGDAEWTTLIEGHFRDLHRVVGPRGGTVIKTLGDGAMVAFGSVRDAVTAAVELQRATSTADFRLRVGLHTGDAVHASGDYAGVAVNKAARIASAADGGEILVSSITAQLAGTRDFRFGSERVGELKGLSGTHRLTPVVWADNE